MKIAILSPNARHLQDIAALLQPAGHTVVPAEGGKSRMRAIADDERPDLMIVDGMCCDPGELALVEQVTALHPALRVMLLCASHTPEFLIASMRAGVREVLPSPPPAEALLAAVDRLAARITGTHGAAAGRVLAFIASKGGSGSTFLAANLAWQLAETRSVLLVDLNLQFGDALSFLGDARAAVTLADVARDIARLDASLLASSATKVAPGLSVLAAPDDMAQALDVRPEHVDAILDVAVTQYDFVLLDLPRVVDPVATRGLDRADHVYVVMQSSLPHVRNAARLLQVFRSLGYPPAKSSVVLNRYERSAEISLEQVTRSLGAPHMLTVPNSYREVSSAINHGSALAVSARGGAVARELAGLAASLLPRAPPARGLMDRLFRKA
ncbi:AAA family ATPase [Ramlibacter sp. PS4R-6]|uniref:AAA family ATPase n=1 Tax=Ramlibacter sp. PS4R-6 TaxID=3133438 RepID=UPI0030ADB91F